MTQPYPFRRALLVLVLALTVAATACGRPAEQTAAVGEVGAAPMRSVARRLTSRDFGLETASPPHWPVIKIGDEARTVAVAPRMLDVATLRGLAIEDGKVRRDLDLPDAARELPADALSLIHI